MNPFSGKWNHHYDFCDAWNAHVCFDDFVFKLTPYLHCRPVESIERRVHNNGVDFSEAAFLDLLTSEALARRDSLTAPEEFLLNRLEWIHSVRRRLEQGFGEGAISLTASIIPIRRQR